MSRAVNIITNMTRFDESGHGPIGELGRFHNQNNFCGTVNEPEKTYAQGLKDGYAQAEEHAQNRANVGANLQQSLAGIKSEIETGHRHVVSTLIQTALPALAKKHMTTEITDFVMSLAAGALDGQVVLFVHADFEPSLKQIIQSIDTPDNSSPTFIINTDTQISGHTVRATWQGGGAAIDMESTIKKILTHIEYNEHPTSKRIPT